MGNRKWSRYQDIEISTRPDHPQNIKVRIDEYLGLLLDRDLLLRAQYLHEILTKFSTISLRLQRGGQSLLDVILIQQELNKFYDHILLDIKYLSKTNGFIKECSCNGIKCSDIEDFENANIVTWKSFIVAKSANYRNTRFEIFVNHSIYSLRVETAKYFPHDQYGELKIFLPENIPSVIDQENVYGAGEILNLALKFRITHIANIVHQWKNLLTMVLNSPTICTMKKQLPSYFWTEVLNMIEEPNYNDIVQVIRIVLVIPSGTSSVERMFSIMNHIITPSLSLKHLEDRVRISSNSPKDFTRVPFNEFARDWITSRKSAEATSFRKEREHAPDQRYLFP